MGVRACRKHGVPFTREHGPHPGEGRRHRMLDELNLTPEQDDQITTARDRMMERGRELRNQVKSETEALIELMTAPEADRDAIAVQVGRIAHLREQMEYQMVKHLLDTKQLLEPVKLATFDKMIRRALSRGGHGRGGFGGPRGSHRGPGRGGKGPLHEDDE